MGKTESVGDKEDFSTAKAIQNLGRDIQCMKTELKQELRDFKNDFRNDIKQEFNGFKTEINQRLIGDIQNHGSRLTEAEQWLEDVETANMELKDTLLHSFHNRSSFRPR